MEWSVDGASRMKGAKLMHALYICPEVIQITQREFKNNPNLRKQIGREIASVINFITEWSIRPMNNHGSTVLNINQQKNFLSICTDIIQRHQIKISKNAISNAQDYEDIAERDSDENEYRKQKQSKFDAIQNNLDNFKESIKSQIVQAPSRSKPR